MMESIACCPGWQTQDLLERRLAKHMFSSALPLAEKIRILVENLDRLQDAGSRERQFTTFRDSTRGKQIGSDRFRGCRLDLCEA